jgi:hypothetical protein
VPVRARAGSRLTEAGYAEVDDAATVGVAGAPGNRSAKTLAARLPLALQGSWTVLVDRSAAASDQPDVPARLLLVTDAAATAEQRGELLARARSEAPAAVEDLRTAARAQRPAGGPEQPPTRPAAADPFGAGSTDLYAGHSAGAGAADPFASGTGSGSSDPFGRPPAADDPFRR